MGSLALPTGYGVALVACAVLGCAVAVAIVLGRRGRRRAQDRQAELDAALARSQADVEALAERVEELGREVVEARRSAAETAAREADREYVITSLAHLDDEEDPRRGSLRVLHRPRTRIGSLVEGRLVQVLSSGRAGDGSGVRERAVDLVVRTVALGHGVRRALSADVLDRAAAEAHVARRRSRRERRRELREARRLLRAVRTTGVMHRAAGAAPGRDEDAA